MKKSFLASLLILGIAFILIIVFQNSRRQLNNPVSVVGSFYPIGHFANQIGQNRISVATITPPGVEPHDFEPTARDIATINNSKLFIYNGNGLDPWAEKIASDLHRKGIVVLRLSDSIDSRAIIKSDPHFWLDPVLAQKEIELIRDALILIDPAHQQDYVVGSNGYIGQLKDLDRVYRSGLANCRLRDIVTAHSAFGYLAKEYNLNQIAIAGLSPDQEPSPQKLAEVSALAKAKNIRYIFFETIVSPKLSQTIASEIGAQTISFNPLEGLTQEQAKEGKTYLSEMKNNLINLEMALQCQ